MTVQNTKGGPDTYLIGVLLFTGVLRPDLWWVCSSTSRQFSWSQLDRRKGVFERDLDLNPLTVGFSMLYSLILSCCYHCFYTIFTPRSQRLKVDDLTNILPIFKLLHRIFNTSILHKESISVASCDAAKSNVTNVSMTFSYNNTDVQFWTSKIFCINNM